MSGNEINSYCRDIEAYLCRKNDGHLIRVVGPSFELVSTWAADGVPLKIAFRGIDRCFERYYRKGPRRRPVKIDFCEADVLDAFDEWKRATGLVGSRGSGVGSHEPGVESGIESGARSRVSGRRTSLPEHLERVVLRLTSARAGGTIGAEFDALLDRVARELDLVRADVRGLRGNARQAALDRLASLDAELLGVARQALASELPRFAREADDELGGFRATMGENAYAKARDLVVERLLRERLNLPVIAYLSRS